jgi:hypothetical protein
VRASSAASLRAEKTAQRDRPRACTGHAYAVIKVVEFPSDDVRLMQLKNPWGRKEVGVTPVRARRGRRAEQAGACLRTVEGRLERRQRPLEPVSRNRRPAGGLREEGIPYSRTGRSGSRVSSTRMQTTASSGATMRPPLRGGSVAACARAPPRP